MYDIFLLLLIPIFIAFLSPMIFGLDKINPFEIFIHIFVTCTVIAAAYGITISSATSDTQIYNGRVVAKEQEKVSCSHSYDCRCHMVSRGSGKDRRTVRECDTCYEHSHDFDWVVKSTIGNTRISRVNRQGTVEPPRFTSVEINDPYSEEHSWTNYLLASDYSILKKSDIEASKKFLPMIPAYPKVFDYYKVNHVIPVGSTVPELDKWNDDLGKLLGTISSQKKVNVVMILTNQSDQRNFMNSLWSKWVGGKKNDVVVVIASDASGKIAWTQVMTWSKTNAIKVTLRDAINQIGVLDRAKIIPLIGEHVKRDFQLMSVKETEYLMNDVHLSDRSFMIIAVVSLILSLGLAWFFLRVDVRFNDMIGQPRTRRY